MGKEREDGGSEGFNGMKIRRVEKVALSFDDRTYVDIYVVSVGKVRFIRVEILHRRKRFTQHKGA